MKVRAAKLRGQPAIMGDGWEFQGLLGGRLPQPLRSGVGCQPLDHLLRHLRATEQRHMASAAGDVLDTPPVDLIKSEKNQIDLAIALNVKSKASQILLIQS
jgi:hypothetical protein